MRVCYNSGMTCSNLPDQLSTFIGREREIATATRLLHGTRLLTLTGSGGAGKTRLALAVASKLVRRYQDGVWFVDLALLAEPDLAPRAVAAALNLREMPGRPLIETLAATLRTKRTLLLLDNCEHMVAACAQLAYALLTAAPGLRVLATSREPLHVTGETTWAVPPLALPEPGAIPPVEELARIEAIRLFVERAGRITPGFALNEQNALSVSQICHRLGGSPLAIELAAAPHPGALACADRRTAGQRARLSRDRRSHRPASTPRTRGYSRLELQPALRARAIAIPLPVRFCGQLFRGIGRGDLCRRRVP